jgi:sigma-B regulation protein RsbU (phosphoserine phosphatase)
LSKQFFRKFERLLSGIDTSASDEELLMTVLEQLVASEDAELFGIESGRLYRERSQDFILIASIGEFGEAIKGKTVSKNYGIIGDLQRNRLWVISPNSPGFDPDLEAQFTNLDNAAILIGDNPSYIISLSFRHEGSHEELLMMLESIRTTVGLKLRQNVLESQLRQARSIQMSLLPRQMRQLDGFEIAADTVPADEVGGDVYDVEEIEAGVLGVTVADASGHGLPAALQARDVVIGLRMGQARHEKTTALIERLNQIINRSGMTSRFISLFYGELEENGNLTYVNCGHCPPLLFTEEGKTFELQTTGPVLGPLPDATYRRSYVNLRPGESLVIFSDGVTERAAPGADQDDDRVPDQFGRSRLIAVCRENRTASARRIVSELMTAVRAFGAGAPFADDVTVMVIKRLPAKDYKPHEELAPVDPDAPGAC